MKLWLHIWLLLLSMAIRHATAQPLCNVKGRVEGMAPGKKALVVIKDLKISTATDSLGQFELVQIPCRELQVEIYSEGKASKKIIIQPAAQKTINIQLEDLSQALGDVEIVTERWHTFGISRLKAVEGTAIYEGKKTEVIEMKDLTANLSTNNPRQIFGKITGLHIWESDAMGLQLGIAGRGLSPNRTSNFNVRQNGYDISADALGYPESYYTPPAEALERIEIVRGAASLQYGTQFGGMLNFVMRQAPKNPGLEVVSRHTMGSFGYFGTFNSVGLHKGKWRLYGFSQYKMGEGWRPNSHFKGTTNYLSSIYKLSPSTDLRFDYTWMYYLAKQPGGLTDAAFMQNARQSFRSRNWFEVNWHLAALQLDHQFSDGSKLNVRNFGLIASRRALGNLERINVADFKPERTLIVGNFENVGQEVRWLKPYAMGHSTHQSLVGYRLYKGYTRSMQGDGDKGSGPVFAYQNPLDVEGSDYRFPSWNAAFFTEQIFNLSPRLAIVPGLRIEHINTASQGYYKLRVNDAAGNIVAQQTIYEQKGRQRTFPIFGLGTKYQLSEKTQFYANISQNYRAINFSDLRIDNPNLKVDTLIKDETGFTADAGLRGEKNGLFTYELTVFYLKYNGRIGQVLRADRPPLYIDYRYRTNVSDARNLGLELLGELNILPLFTSTIENKRRLSIYANFAWIDARYVNTQEPSIRNRKVEMVPPVMLRTGLTGRFKQLSATIQVLYTSQHYSDATNAIRTATAVEGVIPAYTVADASLAWQHKRWTIEASCHNLLDARYFTRRAENYPGPGIIPADGRSFYLTLAYRVQAPKGAKGE